MQVYAVFTVFTGFLLSYTVFALRRYNKGHLSRGFRALTTLISKPLPLSVSYYNLITFFLKNVDIRNDSCLK